jgi:adenosylmethionine-8-amino-7-oxononanoate aminotransferase
MTDATTIVRDHPLWHPFSDMGTVGTEKLVLDRGEGIWVYDTQDRRYMDATASLWCANVGHGRPEISQAVAAQLDQLDTFNIFGDYANQPALDVAARLAALSPMDDTKVFLGSGGGDMLDTAAKIARAHFAQRGQPQRTHLISRSLGYHGTHGLGTSLAGIEANGAGWGRLVPDVSVVARDDARALEDEILRVGPDRVAAFFCEPVIGAGGVHHPVAGYIEAVADVCQRYGVLFVADCVICGFGRLGTWFGIDRWPVEPDMIAVAKGITGGTMPLGALLVSGHVAAPFFTGEPGAPVLRHGQTYAGHPACCAAAMATMDILEREELIGRGKGLEQALANALRPLAENPMVGEVRAGLGLMAGVDLASHVVESTPGAVAILQRHCREAGILVRPLIRGIAVSPPLTITPDEIVELGALIAEGFARLEPLVARNAASR